MGIVNLSQFLTFTFQWLVKRSLEAREERAQRVRAHALLQYDHAYKSDLDDETCIPSATALPHIQSVQVGSINCKHLKGSSIYHLTQSQPLFRLPFPHATLFLIPNVWGVTQCPNPRALRGKWLTPKDKIPTLLLKIIT